MHREPMSAERCSDTANNESWECDLCDAAHDATVESRGSACDRYSAREFVQYKLRVHCGANDDQRATHISYTEHYAISFKL
jgi:hypothetical protein